MKVITGVIVENGKRVRRPIILENRICEECNDEFEPKKQDSKYCSRQCSKKAEYKRNSEKRISKSKEYYYSNIEKSRERRKEYYWKNPEKWRQKTKDYYNNCKDYKRIKDSEYKDKIRHDGKRKELLEQNGFVCSECGKKSNSFDIIAHHKTFNNTEHEHQELLCRSCHAKIHNFKPYGGVP